MPIMANQKEEESLIRPQRERGGYIKRPKKHGKDGRTTRRIRRSGYAQGLR